MCRLAFEPLIADNILDGMTDPPPPPSPSSSTFTTSRTKAKTRIVVSDAERSSWESAFAARPQLLLNDDEGDIAVGTASLLRFLHQAYPTTQFSFCLGADSYQDLLQGKWREGASVLEVLDQDRLVVLARSGVHGQHPHQHQPPPESLSGRHSFVTVDELSMISSTQVRACCDVQLLRTMVPPAVLQYMQQHELYMFAKTTSAVSALFLSLPTTPNV
jgi:nicotinic acid mononucleotide adenylyltransferase